MPDARRTMWALTWRRSKICQKIIIANTAGKDIQMLEV